MTLIFYIFDTISSPQAYECLNVFSTFYLIISWGFPGGTVVKESLASSGDAGDVSSTPGSGRSSGEGNGNPLQYSCLENSMDSGTWCVIVHGVAESDITKHACMHASDTFISFVYSIRYVSNYFSQNGQLIQFSSVQSLSHVRLFVTL